MFLIYKPINKITFVACFLLALTKLLGTSFAFDSIEQIVGDGSDATTAPYIFKRCGMLYLSMSENFKVRNNPSEKAIIEELGARASLFISTGRQLEQNNYPAVTEKNHIRQLELISQMYVSEMETSWAKTGSKISPNITKDLETCTSLLDVVFNRE